MRPDRDLRSPSRAFRLSKDVGVVGPEPPAKRRKRRLSLRMVLIYVALGSAFLPSVLVSAIFTLTHGRIAQGPIIRTLVASEEATKAVFVDRRGELAVRQGYATPAWLDLVIENEGGYAVFSTIPSVPVGSRPSIGDVAAYADRLVPKVTFLSDRLELGKGDVGTWFAILPSDAARAVAGETGPLMRLASLAVLAAVALVFGVTVAAFLATQMGRLERAATAIATGDLETPVKADGTREIVALAEAMEGMRRSIREHREQRSRFLATVSHDLRTPLTSIGGYLEAIEDGLAEERSTLDRYVATMREKTLILEERIEGLIDLARMESGDWRLRFEDLGLAELFEAFISLAKDEAELAGAALTADVSALGDIRAQVDRGLLSRAFENLVANALRHGRPGGTIAIGARRIAGGDGGPLVVVDVDDDGPGIPAADRERAFEAFWRGGSQRGSSGQGGPSDRGRGLGLYIARSIVEGHGWSLEIGSSPSGGARLSIAIPTGTSRAAEGE